MAENVRTPPLTEKMYLTIGAGVSWRHPEVICLDHDLPNAEVALDLNQRVPLPFDDSRFVGVYTSHCLEHLKESQVKWWVGEVVRTLKNGGIFRITSPDIKAFFDAYEARDASFYDWIRGRGAYQFDSWLRLIVRSFAEPVVDKYDDEELYRLYQSMTQEEFRSFFSDQVENVVDERFLHPDCHKSWWHGEKMVSLLLEAGFAKAELKEQNDSDCEIFRQKYFNRTRPHMSFFVEAIK
jgi:predicted SAM-dependent methyltransferase